uniref:Uncharacterized protein n=1 Tax=Arundo donax TaxID=35708 RepID=A0A0A8Z7H5_ARUDO
MIFRHLGLLVDTYP